MLLTSRIGLALGILLVEAGDRDEANEAPRLGCSAGEPAWEPREIIGRLAPAVPKPARDAGLLVAATDRRGVNPFVGIEGRERARGWGFDGVVAGVG
jgi:hypothetical protein